LIFNTKKIDHPKSRTQLLNEMIENRDKIMSEVLVNLNSIVYLLKRQQKFSPGGISRIADWELFSKKIHVGFPEGYKFRYILEKMDETKDIFGL